jgi:hypothetical protein
MRIVMVGNSSSSRAAMVAMLVAALTSCASGTTLQQADQAARTPDLSIPAAQLQEPTPHLAPLLAYDDASILRAHAGDARAYDAVVIQLQALQCTLLNLVGVTINGSVPTPRESCPKPATKPP